MHAAVLAASLIAAAGAAVAQTASPTPPAPTAPPAPAAGADAHPDAPQLPVSGFEVTYVQPGPGLPPLEEILSAARAPIVLGEGGWTLAADLAADPGVTVADLNASLAAQGPALFSRGALDAVNRGIVRALTDRGLLGVLVATDPDDVAIEVRDPAAPLWSGANEWADRRAGRTSMRVLVYTSRVVQVRTVASGDRIPDTNAVDNPAHARIRERSPVAPAAPGAAEGADVLRRDLLDLYTLRLNRHPGRRVDVAVSAAEEPGTVTLDYLVRENKPWFVFSQLANNGTRQTEEIRERFGLVHNQLTGNDDQLVIDFITAGFGGTHGVNGSYEFPIGERLRLRGFGSYSRYDASEVGQADEGFRGESWAAGGDLAWNFFQRRELFIDLVGGLRHESVRANNQTTRTVGADGFLIPSLGLRLERYTDEATTTASIMLEHNLDDIAATGSPSLENLGRTDPDEDFSTLHWGAEHAFFLEPIFDGAGFRAGRSTLAHEIGLRFSGQNALGDRLTPTFQGVVGGMDSVRGYPESAVAGDDVYVGSLEYRLHIPSLLTPYDEVQESPPTIFGKAFRFRPQTRYARPDWDLIGKMFIDAGFAASNDRLSFEDDETLVGTGLGVEFLIGRNFNLRVDWGVALSEVEQPTRVTPGSSRVHFVVTLLF
ncbi:MAG: ShlB/FhaC/HecB family hemolysin secretion/activation protein [Planctomycetota bacterium]|nr:ShlB/FhaC/HecB family hemolysin secretion/activation protein [Planctomycetota bacterium]